MNNYKITQNKVYLEKDGEVIAYIDFSFTFEMEEKVSFDKVYVKESLRGKSIASDLVKFSVEHFIKEGYIIVATCPYVDIWMNRHKEEFGKYMVKKQGGPVCSL